MALGFVLISINDGIQIDIQGSMLSDWTGTCSETSEGW